MEEHEKEPEAKFRLEHLLILAGYVVLLPARGDPTTNLKTKNYQ